MKDTAPFTWILRRAESPERKSPRHHPLQSRDARPPRPTFNINEVKIDYSLVVQPCHDKPVTCERLSNTVRLRKTLLRSLAYLIPGEPRDSKPACLSAHSPAIWHNWRSASTAPHTSRVRCPHLDPWTGWTSERSVPLLGFMKHPKPIANVFEPFWLLQRDKTFPTLSSGCQRTFLPSNRLVTFPKHSRVWKVSLPFVIVQTSGFKGHWNTNSDMSGRCKVRPNHCQLRAHHKGHKAPCSKALRSQTHGPHFRWRSWQQFLHPHFLYILMRAPCQQRELLGFMSTFLLETKGKLLHLCWKIFPLNSSPELSPKTLSSLMVTFCPQKMPWALVPPNPKDETWEFPWFVASAGRTAIACHPKPSLNCHPDPKIQWLVD